MTELKERALYEHGNGEIGLLDGGKMLESRQMGGLDVARLTTVQRYPFES